MIQDMIADISSDADAARLLVWRAADLIRRGEPCEAAVRAANLAIQAFGGYGYVDE
jgi:alkylation response protein AidB-like acyl-CoA dehydrogenase